MSNLLLAVLASGVAGAAASGRPAASHVVFVCEHGSVKSLIAKSWFERLAAQRGLELQARSRGLTPDDAVPEAIAARLREDGFDVTAFEPRPLTREDLEGAVRVVAIGTDTTALTAGAALERWDDIPPASEDYGRARDALKARIERLLESLAK